MSSVIDLLKSHRSIRKFTDKAIDPEVLNDIFLAGQAAATSSFLQGSTIIRVKNNSSKTIILVKKIKKLLNILN